MHLNSILRVWPGDKEQSAGIIQGQVHFTRKYLNWHESSKINSIDFQPEDSSRQIQTPDFLTHSILGKFKHFWDWYFPTAIFD